MALISRSGILCSLKHKNIFKTYSLFTQQIYYNNSMFSHKTIKISACLLPKSVLQFQYRFHSNNGESKQNTKDAIGPQISTGSKLSQRARLKQAVRDYGATIIVFHVAISLASLGICYLAISNGVDAISILQRFGFPDYVISSKIAIGSSTFVMAYAVHKLFAPARIALTLSSAPFIVRYLRKINFIKPPPK